MWGKKYREWAAVFVFYLTFFTKSSLLHFFHNLTPASCDSSKSSIGGTGATGQHSASLAWQTFLIA